MHLLLIIYYTFCIKKFSLLHKNILSFSTLYDLVFCTFFTYFIFFMSVFFVFSDTRNVLSEEYNEYTRKHV